MIFQLCDMGTFLVFFRSTTLHNVNTRATLVNVCVSYVVIYHFIKKALSQN